MIYKWFNKQTRLMQLILMLIPGVNWFIEFFVRWGVFTTKKSGKLLHFIIAILYTFGGLVFGYIDFIWILLFKHLIFAK